MYYLMFIKIHLNYFYNIHLLIYYLYITQHTYNINYLYDIHAITIINIYYILIIDKVYILIIPIISKYTYNLHTS